MLEKTFVTLLWLRFIVFPAEGLINPCQSRTANLARQNGRKLGDDRFPAPVTFDDLNSNERCLAKLPSTTVVNQSPTAFLFQSRNLSIEFQGQTSVCAKTGDVTSSESGSEETPEHYRFVTFFKSLGLHPPSRELWKDNPDPLKKYSKELDENEGLGNPIVGFTAKDFRAEYFGDKEGNGLLKTIEFLEKNQYTEEKKDESRKMLTNIAMLVYMSTLHERPSQIDPKTIALYYSVMIPLRRLRKRMLQMILIKRPICPEDPRHSPRLSPSGKGIDPFHDLVLWKKENKKKNQKFILTYSDDDPPPLIMQKGSVCYIAAVSMLVSHLLKMADPTKPWKLLDFNSIVEYDFNERKMLDRVIDGKGNSVQLLDRLLCHPKLHEISLENASGQEIYNAIEKYGPAIVSGWFVTEEFKEKAKNAKPMICSGKFVINKPRCGNMHAMLLVGARQKNDIWQFKFQNWWADAFWVQADLDYFRSAMADSPHDCTEGENRSKIVFVKGAAKLDTACNNPRDSRCEEYGEDGGVGVPYESDALLDIMGP